MESSIGYRLVKLGGAAGDLFERCLEPVGLRPRHVRVLAYVREEPRSQQELSRLIGMDRTTMVSVVDDLERLGLASRESAVEDRRKRVITPTRAGLRALAEAAGRLEKAEADLLAPLSAADQRQLGRLIGKLFTPDLLNC